MIDPRSPNFADSPASPKRPRFSYAPRPPHRATPPDPSTNGPSSAPPPPVVSIITPFYNSPSVFHETAACVFAQSLQAWEWLIINDGSSDPAALALLEEYRDGRRDPRIRVIDHPHNRGLPAARNTGYAAARADYVFQLDADDLIEPTTLEKCAWFLATHPEYSFVKGHTVGFGAQEYLSSRGWHEGDAFLQDNLVTATAMVRRCAHQKAGGFDESIRGGLEDWDFWLRCAACAQWGATIPEYLDWYRRRDNQWDTWENVGPASAKRLAFHDALRDKYPALFSGGFPWIAPRWQLSYDAVPPRPLIDNPLAPPPRGTKRLLMILPWLTLGGADKFNMNFLGQIVDRGWEVTIATTLAGDHSWMPEFSRHTPDVFSLANFIKPSDSPVFLRYLIESRHPDVVMVSNSELGYLCLPYLRAHCPVPAYVDYTHMEEDYWKNGGYPRYAVAYQPHLDLNIVASNHLKHWMVDRGAGPARVEPCHICVDTDNWRPDPDARAATRQEWELDDDRIVILYAGRLVRQKQPRVFAPAILQLAQRGLPFTAMVAGAGDDLGYLQDFVRHNRLDRHIRFLGSVPAEGMHAVMAASDIFFLPSLWEGIALTIYEAMSVGLAIVGADVGGQKELVTPDCGILLPRSNETSEAAAYADALAPLIDDPLAAREMGRRARERVENLFRLDEMADRMLALFARAREFKQSDPRPAVDRHHAQEAATLAVEYTRAFSLSETLWNERDALRNAVESHAARLAGMPDPRHEVQRIIAENIRYRVADRLNNVLKSVRIHRSLKATVRALAGKKRV